MAHYLMICDGECSIANEATLFLESLKATVRVLAKDVTNQLKCDNLIGENDAVNFAWQSSADPKAERPHRGGWQLLFSQAVYRCDETADGLFVSPVPNAYHRKKILQAMFAILNERFSKNRSRFSPTTLLLLNTAVELKNGAVLKAVFEAMNGKIPHCTMAYLMKCAIERWFDEGVYLLLNKFNASPVDGILPSEADLKPIALCSFQMTSARLGGRDAYYLTNIWKMLLNKISSTKIRSDCYDEIFSPAFANLCDIAIVDSEAVEMLVDAGRDYLKTFDSNDDVQGEDDGDPSSQVWSVVKRCFASADYSRQEIAKIVAFALLPLLRAGCRCTFSSYDIFRKAFAGLFKSSQHYDKINAYLFGRPEGLFELAMELYVKFERPTWFNSDDSVIVIDDDLNAFSDDELMQEDGLTARFRWHSPLRLKNLARRAILRRLNFGLIARQKVVSEMELSSPSKDFLNFRELEPLHK